MILDEMLCNERRCGLLTAVDMLVRRGFSREQAMQLLKIDEDGNDIEEGE